MLPLKPNGIVSYLVAFVWLVFVAAVSLASEDGTRASGNAPATEKRSAGSEKDASAWIAEITPKGVGSGGG